MRAGSREPGAGSRRAGSREPGAGSREPGAGSREPGAGSREPGAGSREPGAEPEVMTAPRQREQRRPPSPPDRLPLRPAGRPSSKTKSAAVRPAGPARPPLVRRRLVRSARALFAAALLALPAARPPRRSPDDRPGVVRDHDGGDNLLWRARLRRRRRRRFALRQRF